MPDLPAGALPPAPLLGAQPSDSLRPRHDFPDPPLLPNTLRHDGCYSNSPHQVLRMRCGRLLFQCNRNKPASKLNNLLLYDQPLTNFTRELLPGCLDRSGAPAHWPYL